MRLVILESPYAAPTPEGIAANVEYARACVRDCVLKGESAACSHLLFTQPGILRDDVPEERALGIAAGLAWGRVAEASVVYTDRGMSGGMRHGIKNARVAGRPICYRSLTPGQPEVVVLPGASASCRHDTDSDAIWQYGTPDSSGWDRTCKVCGEVQHGTFPGMDI